MKKFFNNTIEVLFNITEMAFTILIPLGIILLTIHVVMDVLKSYI